MKDFYDELDNELDAMSLSSEGSKILHNTQKTSSSSP